MAKSRQLKGRIRSVQNTRKITKTMELVATSQAQAGPGPGDGGPAVRRGASRRSSRICITPDLADRFPLLRRPAPPAKGGPSRAAVILLTSNRGLAGGFNSNLIKEARRRIESLEQEGYKVELLGVGKKGIGFFKYLGRKLALERIDVGDRPTADHAAEIVEPLIEAFAAGALASVDLVQARFHKRPSDPACHDPHSTGGNSGAAGGSGTSGAAGQAETAAGQLSELHSGAQCRGDPRAAPAALRAEHGLSRHWWRRRRRSMVPGAPR